MGQSDLTPSPEAIANTCENCDHTNLPNAKFCIQCGAQLNKKCQKCQTLNPPESKFCFECGTEFSSSHFTDPSILAQKILDFGRQQQNPDKALTFTDDPQANDLVISDGNAFLFAVIFDQGVGAERVWAMPYELKKRLGHLNPEKISAMPIEELTKIFGAEKKIHRFWPTMALRTRNASKLLCEKWDGNAQNMWADKPNAKDLFYRFIEFDGIAQKKASMAVNILFRDFGIEIVDKSGIDVSYDIMVQRVFQRTGLVKDVSQKNIINAARTLNPKYPGELDNPTWLIGRRWCTPLPNCDECYLYEFCPKYDI